MSAVIAARQLCKSFGKQVVLDQLDFEILAGRIVGLIGPNGSGKTTTLKAILGLTSFQGDLKVLYALWALPTVGWILMFSARARSRVFPWAYGLPVITWGILLMANFSYKLDWNLIWPTENILVRILGGTLPGTWVLALGTVDERHNMLLPESLFQQALARSSSIELWLGVALGVAMIAIAVHLRGRGEASN